MPDELTRATPPRPHPTLSAIAADAIANLLVDDSTRAALRGPAFPISVPSLGVVPRNLRGPRRPLPAPVRPVPHTQPQRREARPEDLIDGGAEAEAIVNRSAATLARWRRTGRLKPFRVLHGPGSGRRYLYRRVDLERAAAGDIEPDNVIDLADLDARVDAVRKRGRR